ncbi:MAG: HYR domain-containing protein [bacterium]
MKKVSFFIQRSGPGSIPLQLILCFLVVLLAGGVYYLTVHHAWAADAQPGGVAMHAWPCQGHDSRHTGQSPFLGAQTNALKWKWSAGGRIYSSPAIGADGTVYAGSDNGQICALRSQNGSLKWSYETGDSINSSPALGQDGTLYVGSLDGRLYALTQNGSLKWSYQTADEIYSSPTVGPDGTIYVGSLDNSLYALTQDGSLKWSFRTGDDIYCSPAVGPDGSTIYIGSLDGQVYALNARDGSLKWSYKTGYWIHSSPAVGSDGTIYVGSLDGRIYALKPQNGQPKWNFQTADDIYGSPAIGNDGTIYVGSLDGRIYALNSIDGRQKWSYKTGAGIGSSPAIGSDGTVYIGSLDSRIYALKAQDGSLKWSYKTEGGVYSQPAIGADGTVCFGGLDGWIYAFGFPEEGVADSSWPCWRLNALHTGQSSSIGPQTSTLKWKYQVGGEVYASPVTGMDGTIYIGSYDSKIYALDPAGHGVKWSYQAGGRIRSTPAITADGTLYAAGLDGVVYALKSWNGTLKWSYQTGNWIYSSPAVGLDGTVYIAGLDSKVYALKPDGSLKWSAKTGGGIYSSPAIGSDGLVYVGSGDGRIYAFSSQDGSQQWSYQTGERIYSSPALGADGAVYIGSLDGSIYALNTYDGSLKWKYQTDGGVYSSPALGADGGLYIGSLDGRIYALNTHDGSLKWSYQTGGGIYSSPALGADGTIYIGSLDSHIYALDSRDGSLKWSYKAGSRVDSSPAIAAGGRVYAVDLSGMVYAFADDRKDTEPPRLTCPGELTVAATGRMTKVSFTATASDDIDPQPMIVYDHNPGSEFPVGKTMVKVTATDASGNSSTCDFSVIVKDTDPPVVSCPPDQIVPATGCMTRVNFVATAIDTVDPNPKITYDPAPGSEFPAGKTTTVRVVATDASGNSSPCSFKVTAGSLLSPVICPSDITVSATGKMTRVNYQATAANCVDPASIIITYDHEPGSEFPVGTTPVKVTVKDASGSIISTCTFTVTVIDKPSAITFPSDMTVSATGSKTRVYYSVTVPDTGGPMPLITYDPAPGFEFPVGTTPVTVTVKDASGNIISTYTFTVTVTDKPPAITCPSDMTVSATGSKTRVYYSAPVPDTSGPMPLIAYDPEPGSEFPLGTTPVTVTATDSAGKSSTCSFTVQVKDTEAPRITCPGDMTVSALGEKTRVYFTATASDIVDQDPNVLCDHEPGSEFPLGDTDVRVTATDDSGNSSTCSFRVTVRDTTPPVIQCSRNLVIPAEDSMTRVSYTITATDNVDTNPKIVCNPESGSEFPVGTRQVKVTATDAAGNSSDCSFEVEVKDTRPPVINCPSTVDAIASGPLTRVNFTVTATDNVDQNPKIVCDHESGSEFPPGITTVKITATDAAGNSSTSYMSVNVRDSGSPLVTCPEDMTVPATGWKTRVDFSARATDAVDSRLTIVYDHVPGSEFFLGTTPVTVKATDASGNGDECTFHVTVRDEDPPRALCPSDKVVSATGSRTRVDFTARAIDDVDPAPRIVYDHEPGSEFPVGTTRVRVKVNDGSGNYDECTFQVTVRDTEPPRITCPDQIVAPATGGTTRVNFTATATDNADDSPIISYDHRPGSEFPAGSTPVRVTAVDSAGNSSECTFIVVVKDTTPPVITCPANMTVAASTGNGGARVYFTATATDNADRNPVITYAPRPGTEFPSGTTTVRVTATDASGNVGTCSFQVTVGDTTAPQVNCPSDMTVAATGPKTRVYFTATASDNADPQPVIVCDPESGTEFSPGTTTVKVRATDSAGNTGTCTFRVIVQDTATPLATLTLGENPPYDTTQVMRIHYTASDTCDPAPTVKVELSNNRDKPVDITAGSPILLPLAELAGENTVTLTVTDRSGNVKKETVNFEVALKLSGNQITIKPEILRAFPGTFTVSLTLPPPYDTSTVYDAVADGAPHLGINYQPSEQRAVCEFQRADIKTLPLDTQFEVTGSFRYKGTECTFFGTDTIQFVVWPDRIQSLWPGASGRRSVFDGTWCTGPLCDGM